MFLRLGQAKYGGRRELLLSKINLVRRERRMDPKIL